MKTIGLIAGNGRFPILALQEARRQGVKHMIVTHPMDAGVFMTESQMKEAAKLGAFLSKGGGKLTSFTGVPSASVSQFLTGGTTQAGTQTFKVPALATILAKKPKVLMVALGTNMLFNSGAANKTQIRALLAKADAAGTKVVWVGPPSVNGFGGNLAGAGPEARFYTALREVNAERAAQGRKPMTIIDSRKSTNEKQTMDGVHFGGTAAKTWAQSVFAAAT